MCATHSLAACVFSEAKRLAEISSPDFPGERLVACYNAQLAEQRRNHR